jgi:hypothetical protein
MLGGFLVIIWFICPILWGMYIFRAIVLSLFFTLQYSQERVLLAIYAGVCGHNVR